MRKILSRNRLSIVWVLLALFVFPLAYRHADDIGGLSATALFNRFAPTLKVLEDWRYACPDLLFMALLALPLVWIGCRLVIQKRMALWLMVLILAVISPLTAFPLLVGCVGCQWDAYPLTIYNALSSHFLVLFSIYVVSEFAKWRVARSDPVGSTSNGVTWTLTALAFIALVLWAVLMNWMEPTFMPVFLLLVVCTMLSGSALSLNGRLNRFSVVMCLLVGMAVLQSSWWINDYYLQIELHRHFLWVQPFFCVGLVVLIGAINLISLGVKRMQGLLHKPMRAHT